MRVVLVNWAPIWEGAAVGGGVNGYCQSLALALVERGHEVTSLFGGLVYVEGLPEAVVRRHDDWLGIRVFEVINSPVLAPSIAQFKDPLGEVRQPVLERAVGALFRALRPDVVHWHNLEGFSAGCVAAAREAGARVVFSLHNYHALCPQVTLTRDHRWACHDFDAGHACIGCVGAEDPATERRRRAAEFQARHEDSLDRARARLRAEWGSFKHELSWPKRLLVKGSRVVRAWRDVRRLRAGPDGGLHVPGRPLSSDAVATGPLPPRAGAESRGQAAAILADSASPERPDPRDRPVLNVIQPPSSRREPNEYGLRRRELVRMLAGCDRVLAVSSFVARTFESMGVPAEVLRVMPIGTRMNRIVARHPELTFAPPPWTGPGARADRPVRLTFLGFNHFNKGLPLLADALERLDPARLGRLDLSIYARGGETIEWRFRRLQPRLAALTMTHGYSPNDVPWCLGGRDLAYVGSTWWDPAPQTVFEAFACGVPVLGADVGGIPDFVHEGVNGLLFRGNDAADLARRLREVLDAPATLDRLRRGVRPPKDITEHARELERVYAGRDREAGPTSPGMVAVSARVEQRVTSHASSGTLPAARVGAAPVEVGSRNET
jgi:glycosyltransferase involved in cell wall biosynthesis